MEFVMTSHGDTANAFADTLKMFFGESFGCHTVILDEEGLESFQNKVNNVVEITREKETFVFADLIGGTPFNEFAKQAEIYKKGFQLMGGMNLGILIEAVNLRMQDKNLEEITNVLREIKTIGFFQDIKNTVNEEDE